MPMKDYYVILGIPRTALATDVRKAYRTLAKRLHPDSGLVDDDRRFRDLAEAYGVLSDEFSRAEYDRALGTERRPDRRRSDRPRATATAARAATSASATAAADEARRMRRDAPVHAEILLSLDEAARGGTMYVRVPLGAPCPGCAGTGGAFAPVCCATCGGSGVVPNEVDLGIAIPAGVADGTVLEVPVAMHQLRAVRLRALVRVAG
jgi:DnaJ-class molecular chaperone